jgi:hypothetical protein
MTWRWPASKAHGSERRSHFASGYGRLTARRRSQCAEPTASFQLTIPGTAGFPQFPESARLQMSPNFCSFIPRAMSPLNFNLPVMKAFWPESLPLTRAT